MSKVAGDISNLGGDIFGETASYMKDNWENIYVFVWAITITIIIDSHLFHSFIRPITHFGYWLGKMLVIGPHIHYCHAHPMDLVWKY